jgi:hypothetical protein
MVRQGYSRIAQVIRRRNSPFGFTVGQQVEWNKPPTISFSACRL